LGGLVLALAKISGYFKGHSIVSINCFFIFNNPPTSLH
jgi:hypothetical protein